MNLCYEMDVALRHPNLQGGLDGPARPHGRREAAQTGWKNPALWC